MVSAKIIIAIAAGSVLCTHGDSFATVVPALSPVPVHASTQLRKTSPVRKPAYTVRVQASSSNAIVDQQAAAEADFVVETAALSASVPEEQTATSGPLVGGLLLFAVSSFVYLLKTLKSQVSYSGSDEEAVPLKTNQPYTFAALAVDGTAAAAVSPPQPQFEIADTQFASKKKSSSQTKFAQTPAVAAPSVTATKSNTTRKPADSKKVAAQKAPAPAKKTAPALTKKIPSPKIATVQKSVTTTPALVKKAAASIKEAEAKKTSKSASTKPAGTKKSASPATAEKTRKSPALAQK